MADHDSLGQSLSEEESELHLPPASKEKKVSLSPTRQKDQKGFKFTAEQKVISPADFDFASQSKNGQVGASNSHSSSYGEDPESFVVLSASTTPEGEMNGGGDAGGKSATPAPPTTPSKLPTPHKRTAELADTGSDLGTTGAKGSPPSSPAPKKHKAWNDYLAEDDAKRIKKKEGGDHAEVAEEKRYRNLNLSWQILAIVVVILPVFVAMFYSPYFGGVDSNLQSETSSKPRYSWTNAHGAFHKKVLKMRTQFPKQYKETWIQLIASITSTLEETTPDHPAAITVLLPPKLPDQFAKCFVEKVGGLLNSAVAPVLQNASDPKSAKSYAPKQLSLMSFQGSSTITKIREDLDSYLSKEGKAVVVHDICKLEKEEHLMRFHGLCDSFLPVDKRATILFLVRVPQEIYKKYEWSHARGGDISTEVLNEAFGKVVSADTGPALVARIADAVILLNEGDEC